MRVVAVVVTFGGLKARGVIKDVGRVLGFSFGERDRISKMVPEECFESKVQSFTRW